MTGWTACTSARPSGASPVVVAVATVVVATHPGGVSPDQRTWHWIVEHRDGVAIAAARAVAHIGDPLALLLIAAVSGAWLGRHRSATAGLAPLVALIGASRCHLANLRGRGPAERLGPGTELA